MFRAALISIFLFSFLAGAPARTQRQDYTDQLMRLTVLTDNRQYREAISGYKSLQANPGTPEWLKAASEYEMAELYAALNEADNAIAALNRAVQLGTNTVRLSELFTAQDRSLVIYQFMYGKKQTEPCPMCTAWIDSFNGIAHHLAQNIDLAIVAAADLPALRAHARTRGWDKLRLLSAGESSFKYDLGSEDAAGNQDSTISVFTRDKEGTVRHFYSVHPRLGIYMEERGIDEYNPIWNVLDLTPQGRGNWAASLDYGTKVHVARR